jgi:hypothetical protein
MAAPSIVEADDDDDAVSGRRAARRRSGKRIELSNVNLSYGLPFFILSAELMIRWNHIAGVQTLGSTGQLLPLIAGAASLVRVVYMFLVLLFTKGYSELVVVI